MKFTFFKEASAIVREERIFFTLYAIFFAFAATVLTVFDKADIHLFINSCHSEYLDTFFEYETYVGDGWLYAAGIVALIFFKKKYFWQALFAFPASGLTAQLVKNIAVTPRPKSFFAALGTSLYFVPGVDILSSYSMPSGHSATAFSMFLLLSSILGRKKYSVACFFAALITGYSRMYLSQHFLEDVFVGSIIGVVMTVCMMVLGQRLSLRLAADKK